MSNTFTFTKAVKQQEKLRMAIDGPSGGGKTWTSLRIATVLAEAAGGRIAVIDSERGSARKYASDFDFDHLSLPDSNPHTYIGAIGAAAEAAYAVLVVDSLSHAWEGTLELKDDVAKRSRSGNSFDAWREVTPVHNDLVDALLRFPGHVIVTMRTKTAYVIEEYEDANGRTKTKPVKIGLKPIQRDGVEYEFDVVGDIDLENTLVISKTRCSQLAGEVIRKPGEQLAKTLLAWLDDGVPIIDAATAAELKDELNARTGPDRAAWMAQFGVKPDALPADRLDKARRFLADHPVTPPEDPPPSGGGVDRPDEQPPGRPDAGAEAAGSGEPAASAPAPQPEPERAPTPDDRTAAVSVSDVGRYSTTVFKRDYDAADRGDKTRVVERLRHAATYVVTGGEHRSLNALTGPELVKVQAFLHHIHEGLIHYAHDEDAVTFVLVATGEEHEVPWSAVDLQAVA
jgi:hypothetical protein